MSVEVRTPVDIVDSESRTQFNFDNDEYIKMRLRVCHDGVNLKGFNLPLDAIVRAKESIANIPILAYVQEDYDGNPAFGDHALHIEVADNKPRLIYDEAPIGIVPESCNYSIEPYEGRYYVYVDAYIWRKYANYAADILDKHDQVPISVELSVVDWADGDEGRTVNKFKYTGITLLGDDVLPGMEHAAGYIEQCSAQMRKRYDEMCSELNAYLSGDGNIGHNTKEANAVEEVKTTALESAESTGNDTVQKNEPETTAPKAEEQNQVNEAVETEPTDTSSEQPGSASEDENTVGFAMNALVEKGMEKAVAQLGEQYWLCAYDVKASKVIVASKEDGNCYAAHFSVSDDGTITLDKTLTRQTIQYSDADNTAPVNDFTAQAYKDMLSMASKSVVFSAEIAELKAFKEKAETEKKSAQIAAAAAEFSDLNEVAEYKELLSKAASMPDVETFKEKCYAIRGKNMKPTHAQVEETEIKGLRIPFSLFNRPENAEPTDALDCLAKRYAKK